MSETPKPPRKYEVTIKISADDWYHMLIRLSEVMGRCEETMSPDRKFESFSSGYSIEVKRHNTKEIKP